MVADSLHDEETTAQSDVEAQLLLTESRKFELLYPYLETMREVFEVASSLFRPRNYCFSLERER